MDDFSFKDVEATYSLKFFLFKKKCLHSPHNGDSIENAIPNTTSASLLKMG